MFFHIIGRQLEEAGGIVIIRNKKMICRATILETKLRRVTYRGTWRNIKIRISLNRRSTSDEPPFFALYRWTTSFNI